VGQLLSDLAERMPEGSNEQRETVATALAADEKASAHLRNAHEYSARMAQARPRGPVDPLTAFRTPVQPAVLPAVTITPELTP
jgi:hypothetical protein